MKPSVVIPTYKRYEDLEKCLSSFKRLDYDDEYEIVVIVNGCDDEEKIRIIVNKYNSLPIRAFFYREKLGAAGAKNKGIEKASGDVIVFIDDDVEVSANWLTELVNCYKDDVGAVGGSEVKLYKKGFMHKIWLWRRGNMTGKILRTGEVISNFSPDKNDTEEVDCLPGANMSIRKDVLDKIGGYDEFYGGTGYREETDFGPRIKKLGYKIIFNPKAKVLHKESNVGGNVSTLDVKNWCYWYYRNHAYFFMKNLYDGSKWSWRMFVLRQWKDSFLRSIYFKSLKPFKQLKAIKEGRQHYENIISNKEL
jgi:GT2 family glycosyltransferase